MVWSAGLAPVKFVEGLPDRVPKARGGRLVTDGYLRVPGTGGRVFAIGDCASPEDAPLPPIASVAEQQGQYLADCFNEFYAAADPRAEAEVPLPGPVPAPIGRPFPRFAVKALFPRSSTFHYYSVGAMASMGLFGGVTDLSKAEAFGTAGGGPTISGFAAMVVWRAGYLSKQLSWQNMILVPAFWLKSLVFGRDISRF